MEGIMSLTDKQQRFAELYEGNATEAASKAGYKHPKDAGIRCLKNVEICRLIQNRRNEELEPDILTRIDRQVFWSKVAMDESLPMKDRLKASELLGKSEGDFITKHAVDESTQNSLADLIKRIQSGAGQSSVAIVPVPA